MSSNNQYGAGSKELVFIVDDEVLLGELATTILTEQGYKTRTFTDPLDVLAAVRDEGARPALLVTDFVMGTMTGLELIEECKKAHPALRTIILSGTVSETYIWQRSGAKPDHFMSKPYQVPSVVKLVAKTLHPPAA